MSLDAMSYILGSEEEWYNIPPVVDLHGAEHLPVGIADPASWPRAAVLPQGMAGGYVRQVRDALRDRLCEGRQYRHRLRLRHVPRGKHNAAGAD